MGLTSNTGPFNAAANAFGVDDTVMTKIPRSKYQFSVELTLNNSIPLIDESYGRQFVFDRVQSVGLPDYQHNLVRTNQYNRVRYVPTRLEPTTASIIFYDTKDSQFQYLLQAYARHYFHGHNIDERTIGSYDTITPVFDGTFGVKAVPTAQRFFFEKIRIISTDTDTSGRIISMYNCMISTVNSDTLSYSDSSPVVWNVQFQPEHVNIESVGSAPQQSSLPDNNQNILYDVARSALTTAAIGTAVNNFAVTTNSSQNNIEFVVDSNGNSILDANGNPITRSNNINTPSVVQSVTTPIVNTTVNAFAGPFVSGVKKILSDIF